MADKILNTRISLKYGAINEWSSTFKPLKGEVCFAEVATEKKDAAGNIISVPAVVFKVGDGVKTFGELPWASALAADVYDWAKEANLAIGIEEVTGTNDSQYVNGLTWDATTHTLKPAMVSFDAVIDDNTKASTNAPTTKAVKTYVDTEVQKAVSGGVEGLATEEYVDNAIDALSADNGAIKAVVDDLAAHETAFGEFKTANTKAIADAVAAEAAIARDAEKKNADAIKTNSDAIDAIEADYLKAADLNDYAKTADVVTNEEFIAFENTNTAAIADAKKAGTDAQATANDAKTKIDAFLGTITPGGATDVIDTLTEIQEELDRLGGAVELEQQFAAKADKVSGAIAGNFAGLDANGNLIDSGKKAADFDAAGAAAQALADAKADTTAQIEALELGKTYEPIGAEKNAKDYADSLASNYDAAGSANNALESAKAYTDELANGTVKTNSEKIAALEALEYILNGDTVILDCGGAN